MIYNYVFFIIQMKDFYFSDSINQEIILEDKWIIILYHSFKIMWINFENS